MVFPIQPVHKQKQRKTKRIGRSQLRDENLDDVDPEQLRRSCDEHDHSGNNKSIKNDVAGQGKQRHSAHADFAEQIGEQRGKQRCERSENNIVDPELSAPQIGEDASDRQAGDRCRRKRRKSNQRFVISELYGALGKGKAGIRKRRIGGGDQSGLDQKFYFAV